jgi:hypothetical protein
MLMADMPHVVLAAYKTKLRDPTKLRDLMVDPPPDGRIPDKPENAQKRQMSVEEKKADFAAEAASLKATGDLAEIQAVNLNGQDLFQSSAAGAPAAAAFYEWLSRFCTFRDVPYGGQAPSVLFYGFDLKPLLRLTGVGAIRAGHTPPLGLWYANEACYDPFDMLTETEAIRKQISVQKLCKEAPGGAIECDVNYVPGVDLQHDLRLVTALCLQYRLLPTYATQGLVGETLDATTPKPDDLPPEAAADLDEDDTTYDDDEPEPTAPRGSHKVKSKAR